MAHLGVGGLVDVNLGTLLTQVPDNPSTRYAYIQGSIIKHALGGLQTDDVSWGEVLMGVASYGD